MDFLARRVKRKKLSLDLKTRDLVKAVVLAGKKAGTYVRCVAVRATGFFNIKTKTANVQGIAARYCKRVQAADGYHYITGGSASSTR